MIFCLALSDLFKLDIIFLFCSEDGGPIPGVAEGDAINEMGLEVGEETELLFILRGAFVGAADRC